MLSPATLQERFSTATPATLPVASKAEQAAYASGETDHGTQMGQAVPRSAASTGMTVMGTALLE